MTTEELIIMFCIFYAITLFINIFSIRHVYKIIDTFLDYWCEISMKISMLDSLIANGGK